MALTVSIGLSHNVQGVYDSATSRVVRLAGDSAYPFGGYPASATQLGFTQQIQSISTLSLGQVVSGVFALYDPVNNTIRFFNWASTPTGVVSEVATGTSLVPSPVTAIAYGW